ncbi:MAG: EamA family transporter [Melioribacteraceae bacterium]|nr:EamA family transporter [Melioribacteraceae bacterium]
MKKNYKAYIAWLLLCIIWGTTYLAIKVGVSDLPPLLFAGFRWLIAGPIFLIILYFRKVELPRLKDLKQIAIVGICLLGFGNGLVVTAEQWLPSGLTSLMFSTLPFWVVLGESLVPEGIKINLKIVSGLVLGLSGVIIVIWKDLNLNQFEVSYYWGFIAALGAMLFWAFGSVYSKYKAVKINPLMSASIQMIIAGVAQTVLGLSLGEFAEFSFTTESLYAFLYLVFVASIFGYGSYIYAISQLPVSFVSTYSYINPIIALILGWFVLDEPLSIEILFAAVVILLGVYLVKMGSIVNKVKN